MSNQSTSKILASLGRTHASEAMSSSEQAIDDVKHQEPQLKPTPSMGQELLNILGASLTHKNTPQS
jgi:hypothetical protein